MSGRWQNMTWRDRAAKAWMPDHLASRTFEFSEATVRAAEQATAALSRSDFALPANWEPLARLILRTEGIASSSIEGVHAPLVEIAAAELAGSTGDAGWIVDNLNAVAEALAEPAPLDVDTLHDWHRTLMHHSSLDPSMIGAFRTAPSWIGGTSPLDAAFVPPPADAVGDLMDELVVYANQDHRDPVTQAALVHAQFETIHPYGDGNGRLGRMLIGWLLRRRGVVVKLPPPISVLIARDPGGYISGLHLFREGPVDTWVRWFADVSLAAARQSDSMIDAVTGILDDFEATVGDLRADAAARRLIPLLPQAPVLTAATVAQLLDTSTRSGRSALDLLQQRGLMHRIPSRLDTKVSLGRPADHYAATALLDAAAGWAR